MRKGTRAGSPAKVAEEEIERQTGGNDMQILDHLTEAAALFMGLAVGAAIACAVQGALRLL